MRTFTLATLAMLAAHALTAQTPASIATAKAIIDSARPDLRRYCRTNKPAGYLCPIDTLRLARASAALAAPTPPVPVDTVKPPPPPVDTTLPPKPTARRVQLSINRFDGRDTGSVLVSNAIPLPPGALRATALDSVRLLVAGAEQSIYVEAPEARHPDGSLRSVLVQFRSSTLKASAPQMGELVIGEKRLTPPLAKPTTGRSLPAAAALPSDPVYLIATDVIGPTLPASATASLGAPFAQYDADFAKWSEYQWGVSGEDWAAGNYYDRAEIYYSQWVRTANPVYWDRANRMAVNYRRGYVEPNNGRLSGYWMQPWGLETHYVLTADDSSRAAIGSIALAFLFTDGAGFKGLDSMQLNLTPEGAWNDDRLRSRVVTIALLAYRVNANPWGQGPSGTVVYAAKLDTALNRIMSTATPEGAHRYGLLCGGTLNYMQGQLADALIRVFWYFKPDTRILPFVKASTDWLWTRYHSAEQAMEYLSGANTADGNCLDKGGPAVAGDLNNMMVNGFGFVYQQTGDAVYKTRGDAVFGGGVKNAYLVGNKQFNQEYTSSFLYLALRAGLGPQGHPMALGARARARVAAMRKR